MAHDYWTWFEGQEGIERRGRVSDANGRVDLSAFDTVNLLVAKKAGAAPVIDMKACAADADQSSETSETEGKGWFTYTTDAADAAVVAGTYQMSIVGVIGTTLYYFPIDKRPERTYGKLIIHKSLD